MSTNGSVKLFCSVGNSNLDRQTIPDKGSSLVLPCQFLQQAWKQGVEIIITVVVV